MHELLGSRAWLRDLLLSIIVETTLFITDGHPVTVEVQVVSVQLHQTVSSRSLIVIQPRQKKQVQETIFNPFKTKSRSVGYYFIIHSVHLAERISATQSHSIPLIDA